MVTDFNQEAVYDDMGGTDRIYTKFSISVQCLINLAYVKAIAPDLAGDPRGPTDIMNVIRSRLLTQRKSLTFIMNGVNLIPEATINSTVDAKNGPRPISCSFFMITNSTFIVTYSIEAHYWESNGPEIVPVKNRSGNGVLSNKWTETVDIDNCDVSTRTRDGKMIIRSDNPDGKIADEYRKQMVVTGVPEGFTRESSSYTVSPDGLSLKYKIVDKEQFRLPPFPAFVARGNYIEATTQYGAMRVGRVKLFLKGSVKTDPENLLRTAVYIACQKLRNRKASQEFLQEKTPTVLMGAVASIGMYENTVDIDLSVRLLVRDEKDAQARTQGVWAMDFKSMVDMPLSDVKDSPEYQIKGTAGAVLQAAAYYDPSLIGTHLDGETGQLSDGKEVGRAAKP